MNNNIGIEFMPATISCNGKTVKTDEITGLVLDENGYVADIRVKAKDWHWVCNECGLANFTSALSEEDLDWYRCIGCGGDEWHREDVEES